ncbi:hypothetical protein ACIBAI_11360 [Streptomyces sp. NPDC051041]|uniref:hypothetical protein n=1 Tax=Streptomyces sp. NPDC051041 TaxID=3365640 RepID=UPI0037A11B02
MIQQQGQQPGHTYEVRRRRAGIGWFLAGLASSLAFFAFFPGLPHVIDWGALLVSLAVGALARWGRLSWMARTAEKKAGHTGGD